MRITERNGVRTGRRVRDMDGTSLGRVTALYDWGFAAARGFPILFRQEFVVRYDEVRGERDGALVVSRSAGDLTALSMGDVPPSWRIPAPPGFPTAATPPEARGVFEDIVRARNVRPSNAPAELPPQGDAALRASRGDPLPIESSETLTPGEERRYEASRGEDVRPAPPAQP